MRGRRHDLFQTIRTEGGLLPADFLQRLRSGAGVDGLSPESYHLAKGERLNEAVTRAWNRLRGAWTGFRELAAKLPEGEPGTSVTRERWLLILFQELGYGRLVASRSLDVGGKSFPISHLWQKTPIHLVGFRVLLDERTRGVAGAARSSPHGLVQEVLNRSEDFLWGMVSNGLVLRLLRDNASLTRQAYVELDLEAMMDGEAFPDFTLLWLLCHESRVQAERAEDAWLERWTQSARQTGARALEALRGGVERAIEALGRGFLAHPANGKLRGELRSGRLPKQDYYRELLRLVYRLIFLFVAEDRDLLLDPAAPEAAKTRYLDHYSTRRLRRQAEKLPGTKHADLYRALVLVMEKLGDDRGCADLALPALGSFLWERRSLEHLAGAQLANRDLLDAVRALSFVLDGGARRPVDYRNLGPEELGSVYESLLELHPEVDSEAAHFALKTAAGHERKTTGSYYTPESLVQCLLDSALEPVVANTMKEKDPAQALLDLKVCDPACGSGHFLIAAAHRLARRLAALRTGDEEPAPGALRRALREVIGRCIYGVDLNPMAVELCKVSLWMEAIEPGRPLSFLEHRIVCGNSLLGTTPRLLADGVPDAAFEAIEGDEKAFVTILRKRNRQARKDAAKGQFEIDSRPRGKSPDDDIDRQAAGIDAVDDATIAGVHEKEKRFQVLTGSEQFRREALLADAWCAAFVWKKARGAPEAVTQDVFQRLRKDPASVAPETVAEVERLAREYRWLHWHLVFPAVFCIPVEGEEPQSEQTGWSGGFDVVLGNPPWERIKLQEEEWFAERRPEIANAPNAAARRKLIAALAGDDPAVHRAFLDDRRRAEGESHFVRRSGRFPLCGRGDINTYAIFAELMYLTVSGAGRAGCLVPIGIVTDVSTSRYFTNVVSMRRLVAVIGFENERKLFKDVDHRVNFCLLVVTGQPLDQHAEFAFFLEDPRVLREHDRRYCLDSLDIAMLNPNTRTCPVFRCRRDAEITKAIYRRMPLLFREAETPENPWGVQFARLLDMANDSGLFRTRAELVRDGWRLEGNVFHRGVCRYLPLYEAKMIYHFDHRYGDFSLLGPKAKEHILPTPPIDLLQDPSYVPMPRYWVDEAEVQARIESTSSLKWFLGWRDVTDTRSSARTVIATIIPRAAVSGKFPLLLSRNSNHWALLANLSSLVLDYVGRQKIGGVSLSMFVMRQLPMLPPERLLERTPWEKDVSFLDWIRPRVLELVATTWDLSHFAIDLGWYGPPFRWDEGRRFLLRSELDAAFFHLYGVSRDDTEYILDTFPIVRRRDEKRHGEYRTKRVILEIYGAMARAAATGIPYQTLLEPPAADPRVAHPPRVAAAAMPFERVEPSDDEKYRTCVPLVTLKAAAGAFGDAQAVEPDGWARLPAERPLRPGMFIAQAQGSSMEPRIPDGAWCLFQSPVTGTRQGRIVLVEHHAIHDPDTGGSYTLKRYRSDKAETPDGTWRHARICLEPLNPLYQAIELEGIPEEEVRVVAELVEVVSPK